MSLAGHLVIFHTHSDVLGEVGHSWRHHTLDDVIRQPVQRKWSKVSIDDDVMDVLKQYSCNKDVGFVICIKEQQAKRTLVPHS